MTTGGRDSVRALFSVSTRPCVGRSRPPGRLHERPPLLPQGAALGAAGRRGRRMRRRSALRGAPSCRRAAASPPLRSKARLTASVPPSSDRCRPTAGQGLPRAVTRAPSRPTPGRPGDAPTAKRTKDFSMALSIGVSVGEKVFVGDSVVTVRGLFLDPGDRHHRGLRHTSRRAAHGVEQRRTAARGPSLRRQRPEAGPRQIRIAFQAPRRISSTVGPASRARGCRVMRVLID